jgi:hypothetical protein
MAPPPFSRHFFLGWGSSSSYAGSFHARCFSPARPDLAWGGFESGFKNESLTHQFFIY